jgi:hypothetical protein
MDLIWVWPERKYFFEQDWTGGITLIRLNKIALLRKSPAGGCFREDA